MHANVMFSAGAVRIQNVPDVSLIEPTDAVVTRACICGSDLWPYLSMKQSITGRVMGPEAIGVVEAVGADVCASRCKVHAGQGTSNTAETGTAA